MTRLVTCPQTDRPEDHIWDLRTIELRDGLPCACGRFQVRIDTDGRLYYVETDEARLRSSAMDLPEALRGP